MSKEQGNSFIIRVYTTTRHLISFLINNLIRNLHILLQQDPRDETNATILSRCADQSIVGVAYSGSRLTKDSIGAVCLHD